MGYLLKQRNPIPYRDFYCQHCNNYKEETWNHFLSCPARTDAWQELHRTIFEYFKDKLVTKDKSGKLSSAQISTCIVAIMGLDACHPVFDRFHKDTSELIVEMSVVSRISKLLSTSRQACRSIVTDVLQEYVIRFKKLIWAPRCDKVVLWERLHGIDTKMKRSTHATQRRSTPRLTTLTTQNRTMISREVIINLPISRPIKPPLAFNVAIQNYFLKNSSFGI